MINRPTKQVAQRVDGSLVVDREGIILDLSESLSQVLSSPGGRLVGVPLSSCLAPRVSLPDLLATIERQGRTQGSGHLLRNAERLFPVHWQAHSHRLAGKEVIFFLLSYTAFLERQSPFDETSLIDSFLDSMSDSIYFKDRDCRLIRVNQRLLENMGYERMEEVVGKTDVDLFGREFGEMTMAVDRRIMETGEPVIGMVESRRKPNGDINWTLTSKMPLTDEDGDVIGLAGITREINTIKEAEKNLRIKEQQLSIASKIAGLGYWELDFRESCFTLTDEFYQIFGTSLEEVGTDKMGTEEYLERFMHPADRAMIAEAIRVAVETPQEKGPVQGNSLEHRIPLPNGQTGYVAVRFFVVEDERGQKIRAFGVNQNITERKLAELELAGYRDDLEQLVHERTAQLEESNQDLEAFAFSISHDLSGPLRHISGFASILERTLGDISPKSRKYLDLIRASSHQMGGMIKALLGFSRLGRQELNKQQVDLNTLVREVIRDSEIDTRGREIEWKIGQLPVVEADWGLMKLVFENLISNAIKYTRYRERAKIEIATPKSASEATVYIRDNGAGFDMAFADKLFGVFQRLHQEDEFEGTGIGLANVQRIMRKHGGMVRGEGIIDEGATFHLTFR